MVQIYDCLLDHSIFAFSGIRSAWLAISPAPVAANDMLEGAKVSWQVTSHTKDQPFFQGMMGRPSGRLPSDRQRPDGSRVDGTSTAILTVSSSM